MSPEPISSDAEIPRQGVAACGARLETTLHTPSVCYQGEIIHFCSEDCAQLYSEDPLNSCLASRLLSSK